MTMTESTPDTDQTTTAPDFLAFLAGVNKGRTANEAGQRLQELVAAVEDTGKGGTLTLKITVKPASKNSDALVITDEIGLKAPKLPRPESIFFPTADHNLVRNNPNQDALFD